MDLEADDEGFTRQDMMDSVTASVEDELLGSVIKYEVDGETFHQDPGSDDEDSDWDERTIMVAKTKKRRSPRNPERVDYSDTKRNPKAPKPRIGKSLDKASTKSRGSKQRSRDPSSNDSATMTTAAETDYTSDDSGSVEPREDYNNPAKSTTQNKPRTTQGGPLVGKPSEIQYGSYRRQNNRDSFAHSDGTRRTVKTYYKTDQGEPWQ